MKDIPARIQRLRFRHLSLLAALGHQPTLYKAAVAIGLGQPTASKLLADAEAAFDFPIFERHARGLRATPLGRLVIDYAQQAESELSRFVEAVELKRLGGHGQVVFGVTDGLAADFVAPSIAAIKRARPKLTVRMVSDSIDHLKILLERRDIEFAIGGGLLSDEMPALTFVRLSSQTLRWVARRDHPLLGLRHVNPDELFNWPWILPPTGTAMRQLMDELIARTFKGVPVNVIECEEDLLTLTMLQTSDSIALLPTAPTSHSAEAQLLGSLPVAPLQDIQPLGVLTWRDETLSDAAAFMLDDLRKRCQ